MKQELYEIAVDPNVTLQQRYEAARMLQQMRKEDAE